MSGRRLTAVKAAGTAQGIGGFLVYSPAKDQEGVLRFSRAHGFGGWYSRGFI